MDVQDDGPIADPSFDRYARLVRHSLRVPVALVSIVEAERQVFPGAEGLPEAYERARQTPLSHSFCQYVVADSEPLVARRRPRGPAAAGQPRHRGPRRHRLRRLADARPATGA